MNTLLPRPRRPVLPLLLALALPTAVSAGDGWSEFVDRAAAEHGEFGARCAAFLAEHRPPGDAGLDADFLLENLRLALAAREEFPWGATLPDERFLNDVLPYAVLDETREPWRAGLLDLGRAIVADCETPGEAAQALNRELFDAVEVHYHTGRKKPNQSPSESRSQGRATCTGLSILLVDACRAVAVPARVAGTALWTNKRGNHTWVEVWDGERWRFTGADEPDPKGFDRAWFVRDASRARSDDWRHAIWATSWRRTGDRFPMVWDLESHDVPGVDVTARYAALRKADEGEDPGAATIVSLRVFETTGGPRLVVTADLLDDEGRALASVETKAGTADLNDMPRLRLRPGVPHVLRIRRGDEERSLPLDGAAPGEVTVDVVWDDLERGSAALRMVSTWLSLLPEERHLSVPRVALAAEEADGAVTMIAEARFAEIRRRRADEHEAGTVVAAGRTMRLLERRFGEPPVDGPSLWISMHGGGGAPTEVNDRQWKNQIRLYEPEEGIVVAPRAPTDTWNLWHQAHVDDLFDRLIENYVAFEGVDPDRVHLLGYSAGGDGVYQLAPRMADRFAAASMMAGHPNDASPLGLRNLPFRIFVGGKDAAYRRNEVAVEWGAKLAALAAADPEGYVHEVTVYEELGHWMERRDAEALPWMAAHVRDPWPKTVVWRQSARTHDRFHWLAVARGTASGGDVVRAAVDGQTITITSDDRRSLILRLSDALLDLDRPIAVVANGEVVFEGEVERSVEAIHRSLLERADPRSAASATLRVEW
ncbi:MAG: transglutaminase domain-containing protein [Planctomycetota bacterium JB042]